MNSVCSYNFDGEISIDEGAIMFVYVIKKKRDDVSIFEDLFGWNCEFSLKKGKNMDSTTGEYYQNVVVMRHGDRIDNLDPLWISNATQPWDPPLIQEGRVRAFCTGRKFRNIFGFPLHRVFVSPFLRCIHTASEVIVALSSVDENPDALTGHSLTIDPSKLKVYLIFIFYD